jgi:thioredoxin 1
MAGSLREVGTAEWEDEVAGSDVPVLVEFWGDWCAPCHKLNPILEEIAEERSDHLKVVKSDTEANPDLVVTHAVRAAPTLAIFSDGVERWRVVGFRPKPRLDAEIEDALASITASL